MTSLMQGYRGLTLLVGINWDRFLFPFCILLGLSIGAFLGGL